MKLTDTRVIGLCLIVTMSLFLPQYSGRVAHPEYYGGTSLAEKENSELEEDISDIDMCEEVRVELERAVALGLLRQSEANGIIDKCLTSL